MPPVRPIEALWAGMFGRKGGPYVGMVLLFTHGYVVGGSDQYIISGEYKQEGHLVFGSFRISEHPFSQRYEQFFGEDEHPVVDFELKRHFRPDFQYFGAGILTNAVSVPAAFTIGLKPMESFPDSVLDSYCDRRTESEDDRRSHRTKDSDTSLFAYMRDMISKATRN